MTSRATLVAVAHGTADPEGTAAVRALCARISDLRPSLDVVLCHVEHTEPAVADALLAASGDHLVVVPLLLFAATHSKGDIPGAIHLARRQRPDLRIDYAAPLGPHPLLVSALADRLAESGAGTGSAVVLAAAGASDPEANSEVAATARRLWEWRLLPGSPPPPPVLAAFATATSPRIGEAVRMQHLLGHRDVAVASAFLSPGHFADVVRTAARSVDPSCLVTAPLGDHPDIARLALHRYDEALEGPIRANCDMCMFRAPWPGREGRVGEPQRIHDHPSNPV